MKNLNAAQAERIRDLEKRPPIQSHEKMRRGTRQSAPCAIILARSIVGGSKVFASIPRSRVVIDSAAEDRPTKDGRNLHAGSRISKVRLFAASVEKRPAIQFPPGCKYYDIPHNMPAKRRIGPMRLLNPLFALLGASTDAQLARMVEFLKAENRILRDKLPKRITVTKQERSRLLKLGQGLGSAVKNLITIVSPRTFARWVAKDKKPVTAKKANRKPGRPRTAEDIRELILRIARESGFGYTRILGELKKLGIGTVCRSTVVNILKEAGLDPGPKRGVGTWDEFITRHTATLWAADFLSVKTWTMAGVVDLYVLFFIHIGTRRVIISNPTASPDAKWVAQRARNATMTMDDWGLPASYLIIDHDTKFAKHFDEVLVPQPANDLPQNLRRFPWKQAKYVWR